MARDPLAAVRYFRNAAAEGLDAAHNGLGALHLNPSLLHIGKSGEDDEILKYFGNEPNKTAALWHFQQAGNSDSLYSMAQLQLEGWSLDGFDTSPSRFERAFESFARSAEKGHPKALGSLGLALLDHKSWIAVAGRHRERMGLPPYTVEIVLSGSPRSSGNSYIRLSIPLARSCSAALPILRQLSEMGPWSSFHLNAGMKAHQMGIDALKIQEKMENFGVCAWHFGISSEFGLVMSQTNDAWLHQHVSEGGPYYTPWDKLTRLVRGRSHEVLVKQEEKGIWESHAALRMAQAAADRDPDAVRRLGDIHLHAKVPRHLLAVEYYEEAASSDHSQALIDLARLAHHGLNDLGVFQRTSSSLFTENRTLAISSLKDIYQRCVDLGGEGVFPASLGMWQLQIQELIYDLQKTYLWK